jgi:hypothetical protein
MARITKLQKSIADAHLDSMTANIYDDPILDGSLDSLRVALNDGKTIRYMMEGIVTRNVSITSQLMTNHMGYTSEAYKKGVYKGFKDILNKLNIK